MVAILCMNPDRANEYHLILFGFRWLLHWAVTLSSWLESFILPRQLEVDVKELTRLFKRWRGPLALWCGLLSLAGRWDCNEPSVIPLPRIN